MKVLRLKHKYLAYGGILLPGIYQYEDDPYDHDAYIVFVGSERDMIRIDSADRLNDEEVALYELLNK